MTSRKKFWSIILVSCAIIIVLPMTSDGIYVGDDLLFHLNRIEGIKEGLLAGQFPVRIQAYQLNGYGIPTGIFYPDLFLYLPALLRLFGLPYSIVYPAFSVFIILLTIITSWCAFSLLMKYGNYENHVSTGAMAAALYVSYWYYFMDLYKRADVGEAIALAFMPLAIVSFLGIIYGHFGQWPITVIAITGVFQSHLLSTIFLAVIFLVIGAFYWRRAFRKEQRIAIAKLVVFSFLINLWFLLPFLYFYHHMNFYVPMIYDDNFKPYIESWNSRFLLIQSLYFGFPTVIGMAFFLYQWFRKGEHIPQLFKVIFVFSLLCMIACTYVFPWNELKTFPGLNSITLIHFSWRLMILAAPCIVACSAIGFVQAITVKKNAEIILSLICIITCILNTVPFTIYLDVCSVYRSSYSFNYTIRDNVLPSYAYNGSKDYFYPDVDFENMRNSKGELLSVQNTCNNENIFNIRRMGTTISFQYACDKDTLVEMPLFYYDGYVCENSNGDRLEIGQSPDHIMLITLPAGINHVTVKYEGLPLFRVGDWISMISLIALIFVIYKEKNNGKYKFKRC